MPTTVVGVDLGGTSIKAGLVDSQTGLLRSVSKSTEAFEGPDHVLDRVAQAIRELDSEQGYAGIGIGSPGAVNLARTTVSSPPNFPGWHTRNLSEALQQRLGREVPVLVENDANVAAL